MEGKLFSADGRQRGAMKREEGRCEGAAVLKVETVIYCSCVFSVIMEPRPSNAQVSIGPQQEQDDDRVHPAAEWSRSPSAEPHQTQLTSAICPLSASPSCLLPLSLFSMQGRRRLLGL